MKKTIYLFLFLMIALLIGIKASYALAIPGTIGITTVGEPTISNGVKATKIKVTFTANTTTNINGLSDVYEFRYNHPHEKSDLTYYDDGEIAYKVGPLEKTTEGVTFRVFYNGNITSGETYELFTLVAYCDESYTGYDAGGVVRQASSSNFGNEVSLSNANMKIVAPITKAPYIAKMGPYAEFNFDFINSSNPVKVIAIKGRVESDVPIKSIYSTASSYIYSDDTTTTADFNPTTGEFLINYRLQGNDSTFNLDNNPNKSLIGFELDTSGLTDLETRVITTSIKDLKYISSDNIDEEISAKDVYSYTTLINRDNLLMGDWNDDGSFNLVDLVKYRLFLAPDPSVESEFNAFGKNKQIRLDLSNNGYVELQDLIKVRRRLIGIID